MFGGRTPPHAMWWRKEGLRFSLKLKLKLKLWEVVQLELGYLADGDPRCWKRGSGVTSI